MNEKYHDEYISAIQAAWLMQMDLDVVRRYLASGKLKGIKTKKIVDTLIEMSSVEHEFYKKINKYKYATEYFKTDDKDYFWSLAPVQFARMSDVEGYLSITQVALLIGRGRQGVQYLIDTGYLETTKKQRKTQEQTLISEVSLKRFVDDELEKIYAKFVHLIDYINAENKEQFWIDKKSEFDEYYDAFVQLRKKQNKEWIMRRKQKQNGEIQ